VGEKKYVGVGTGQLKEVCTNAEGGERKNCDCGKNNREMAKEKDANQNNKRGDEGNAPYQGKRRRNSNLSGK